MLFIAFEFEELLSAGDRLLAAARYEEALDYYVRVLRIDDESYEGQMGAGRACYQLRRFDEAAEHFSAAVATAPDDATSLVSLALCHSERGRRDEAIIYAERATVIDDTYLHAFTTLARLSHLARQYRRSLEALGAARRIAPDHLEVLYNTGVIHRVLGDNEASVEVLFEAASRYPHSAIVMKELARALHACGNLDAAADFFGRSIQLAPDDPEAHCDLGRLRGETGNHRDAVRHFKRALELDPTLAAAYYNLGVAFAALGFLNAASSSLQQALRYNPGWPAAIHQLGLINIRRGKFFEALEQAAQLHDLDADLEHRLHQAITEEALAIGAYRRLSDVMPSATDMLQSGH